MKLLLPALALIALQTSCDRPECKTTDPAFINFTPDSKEYKAELIRELDAVGYSNVGYWVDNYSVKEGVEYMTVYIQGRSVCAKGILNITKGTGLEHYKEVKGKGYSGAKLRGLRYTVDSANGNYNFIFEQVDGIVD